MNARRSPPLLAGAALALVSAVAAAADVALVNGWMRPAAAGQASVDAYVDIRSDTALKLVRVTTPVAQRVDLVAGTMNDSGYDTKVVATFDVPAKRELRFALKGNVLRLVDIRKSLSNADMVPLRFEFRDASNREVIATTDLQVRGLVAPRPAQSMQFPLDMPPPYPPPGKPMQ